MNRDRNPRLSWRRFVPAVAVLAGLSIWVAAGCKQEEGERCQVNADCSEPLVCNQATQECSKTTGGGIDASVPDAPFDAPVDAALDAPPDTL